MQPRFIPPRGAGAAEARAGGVSGFDEPLTRALGCAPLYTLPLKGRESAPLLALCLFRRLRTLMRTRRTTIPPARSP